VRPHPVRESRLSWRLDACCNPLGGCRADPEPWSLLQSCHGGENRRFAPSWPGCVLRGSLGSRAGRCPSDWSHAPALPRTVRQSAVRNATKCQTSLGKPGPRWPWCPPCARSPRRPGNGGPGQPAQSPSGGVNAALSAAVGRPCVPREARWRRCAATATSTPKTDRCPSRGACPTSQSRCGR